MQVEEIKIKLDYDDIDSLRYIETILSKHFYKAKTVTEEQYLIKSKDILDAIINNKHVKIES